MTAQKEKNLLLDFETQSRCSISNPRYTSDPSTHILCMSYGFRDEGKGSLWWPGDKLSDEVIEHIKNGGMIGASNARFDREIWQFIGENDHDFPPTEDIQWFCTQAQSRVGGLPSALDKSARALRIKQRKSISGSRLITKCCIPPYSQDPQDYCDLGAYCLQDYVVMRDVSLSVPMLNDYQLEDYQFNELVNDRGIKVDVEMAKAAMKYAEAERAEINTELNLLTNGEITACTQHRRVCKWLQDKLKELPDIAKLMRRHKTDKETGIDVVKYSSDKSVRINMIAGDEDEAFVLPFEVKELLGHMADAGGSAVSKFTRMVQKADPDDDRVRGILRYAGAPSTLRYSSMGLQIHNFRRDVFSLEEALFIREQMLKGDVLVDMEGKKLGVMDTLGRLLRSAIIPEKGKVLVVGDWSSVESRMTAWLAGDEKKLDLFRRGEDPYLYEASGIYGRTITKKDAKERQIGKITDLACFGADTLVLTNSGWKPITQVTRLDKVHDGVEFVKHEGVIFKGERLTTKVGSITVTKDHKFLMGDTWVTAEDLNVNTNCLKRAHDTAILQLSESNEKMLLVASSASNINVNAEPSTLSITLTLEKVLQHDATYAQNKLQQKQIQGIQKYAGIKNYEGYCMDEYRPSLADAITKKTARTRVMADEGLKYTRNGLKTGYYLWDTSVRYPDAKTSITRLTELITTGRTYRGTYDSYPIENSSLINEVLYGSSMGVKRCRRLSSGEIIVLDTLKPALSIEKSKKGCHQKLSLNTKGIVKAYTVPVFDIVNAGPRNRYVVLCNDKPLIAHNCGFMGGVGALASMANQFRVYIDPDKMQAIVDSYRANHPKIVEYSDRLMGAAIRAVMNPGTIQKVAHTAYLFNPEDGALYCQLTGGINMLRYPEARIEMKEVPWSDTETRPQLTALKAAFTPAADAKEWARHGIWRGILIENCISLDTLVATNRGWTKIQDIQDADLIWDGEEFVKHSGLAWKGNQFTVKLWGVRLTPDHEVLTDENDWQSASSAQHEGYNRHPVRLPNSLRACETETKAITLAGKMRLWDRESCRRKRPTQRARKVLRLQDGCDASTVTRFTWNVIASRLLGMAVNAGSLQTSYTSSLGQLWRQGHNSLQTLGRKFRELLGRYGRKLQMWLDTGPFEQQRQLHTGKLCLENVYTTIKEPQKESHDRDSLGPYNRTRSIRKVWNKCHDDTLQTKSRMGLNSSSNDKAQLLEQVYDITNCGPRHRFVVKGEDGPVIVHNCAQGNCAQLLREKCLDCEDAGLDVIFHVHDEIILEVPIAEAEAARAKLREIMERTPHWLEGLPLVAEPQIMTRYGK